MCFETRRDVQLSSFYGVAEHFLHLMFQASLGSQKPKLNEGAREIMYTPKLGALQADMRVIKGSEAKDSGFFCVTIELISKST